MLRLALLLGLAPLTPGASSQTSAQELDLFDGATLAGWDGDPRYWSVQDGALVGESSAELPLARTTYLVWQDGLVGDFELSFAFKIDSGNSGLQFRGTESGRWSVEGYQADLEDGPDWTGCLYEQGGRGVVARRGEEVTLDAAGRSVATFAVPPLAELVRRGEWNRYRVRAVGPRLELFVNDRPTAVVVDRDERRASAAGVLAFQLHQGPPMRVAFRDVRLRHLGPPPDDEAWRARRAERPQWLWCSREPAEGESAHFTTRFFPVAGATRTLARVAADNHLELRLDGRLLAAHSDWTRPCEVDLTPFLGAGQHELDVWCKNDGGPAGFWAELEAWGPGGLLWRRTSDASWRVHQADPEDWFFPHTQGFLGDEPWGAPGPAVPGRIEAATDAATIRVPDGFAVELVYSVPLQREGSWVSLTFDPEGRALASDQSGRLYALDPAVARAGGAARPIAEGIGSAQGLACAFGALYVMVNGANPESGLYRLRDRDGDGFYEERERLLSLEGSGEHGPHAVVPGPDGRSLWLVAGNHTRAPAFTRSRVPLVWGEDQLLPRREDPNGHAAGIRAPGGWIARCDPDGRRLELVCVGLRNAYDLDFDARGEPFTFDADMEWDVGLPWYRPTRVLHALSGADFGWRSGSGKWPADAPDSVPALLDIGRASPTGVVHGRRGAFPAPWRDALFVADWSFGRIHAVALTPAGGSYAGERVPFLAGRALAITDLAFGPDGALWFTTGGRGAQSGLYRVSWEGARPEALAGRRVPARTVAQRRELEALHGTPRRSASEFVWRSLAHGDPAVERAARTALEFARVGGWRARALAEEDERTALAALLALVRVDAERSGEAAVRRVLARGWLAPPTRAALRVVELACARGPALSGATRDELAAALLAAFPERPGDAAPGLERELAKLLVHLQVPAATRRLFARLDDARTQEEALHYAWCLRVQRAGWDEDLRDAYLRWLVEAESRLDGGASLAGYLADAREDFLAGLAPEEAERLRARVEREVVPAASADAGAPLPAGAFVQRWRQEDLEGALFEVSTGRSFEAGERVWRQASCGTCHRFEGAGSPGREGPDLTSVGGRFTPRDLLRSLLEPSRDVPEQFRDTEVWTRDGDLLVGRLLPRDGAWIRVQPRGTETAEIEEVRVEDVELMRPHPLSPMPEGLLDPFTRSEILDLLAYLIAGGDPTDAAFE